MSAAQVLQVSASLCVLVPFVLVQLERMRASSPRFLVPNLVGSATLAVDGALGHDWGFLLLEGVWALVSMSSLIRNWTHGEAPPKPTRPPGKPFNPSKPRPRPAAPTPSAQDNNARSLSRRTFHEF